MKKLLLITLLSSMPVAYASKTLAEKNGCLGCHAQNVKLVGPSYQEVAKKYAGDSDAKNRLADKIIHGGAGNWGDIPMPAHPKLSKQDASKLIEWILKGAN